MTGHVPSSIAIDEAVEIVDQHVEVESQVFDEPARDAGCAAERCEMGLVCGADVVPFAADFFRCNSMCGDAVAEALDFACKSAKVVAIVL